MGKKSPPRFFPHPTGLRPSAKPLPKAVEEPQKAEEEKRNGPNRKYRI